MTAPTYRPLRIVLFVLSAVEGVAGLVLLFASPWVLGLASGDLATNGDFARFLVMGIGLIALALSYLVCVTARDPVRYVAVIDVLAFLLVAAPLLNVFALVVLHLGAYYPASYLIARSILQLALAVGLVALRPKRAAAPTPA